MSENNVSRAPTRCGPIRVLIVDDNVINRELAAALLACWGAQAVEATNGAEAVSLVAGGPGFDLVLMDIQMPVLNGLEATARIREIERQRLAASGTRVPIVAVSSEVITADEAHLLRLGMDGVLPKPLTSAALMACIERWCPDAIRSR